MASRPLRDDSRRTFWPSLGPRAQTTLPQTLSGFSRRVDVARMLALGDARGGSSIHVTTQEPKDPLTFWLPSERQKTRSSGNWQHPYVLAPLRPYFLGQRSSTNESGSKEAGGVR
jgi:hypothetical protein